ncbi:related to PUB1-major polyadenylated RNA-binding protein of nucleus and cytoplasm [Sporisorium reilianum SRZ2]|uniref:Related to PUB1-major polyadenylated RNA-binding protein of nucleus and cytoplasm n=1 Tax=Sporisorium reilianum (strain SRZ2) TaxID=999809 RepID=E6ZTN3_SPORE|nr:related to PUB1-major polyadenylated RNA-binding protein of nucleus and cytoplasm [Sporisorium reilianum SRZ2]
MPLRPLVHVANLPATTTERELFGALGAVQTAKVVSTRAAGGLAYGFVEYGDVASAERAVRTMDAWLWLGTPIKVCWARHSMHPDAVEAAEAERAGGMRGGAAAGNSHLFVGDLAPDVDDAVVHAFFSRFASLADVRVMYDPETGKSRGFGFISLRSKSEAEECIAVTQGRWLGGRQIRVNWASQKNQGQAAAAVPPAATGMVSSASPHPDPSYTQRQTGYTSPSTPTFDTPSTTPLLPRRHTTLASAPRLPASTPTYDQILASAPSTQTSVYVGNISPHTTPQDLVRIFAPFNHGQRVEARIPPPPGRGYGFVTLTSHAQAASAICALSMQGVFLHSRWLRFGWQKDRGPGSRMQHRSESAPESMLYTLHAQAQHKVPPIQHAPQQAPAPPRSSSSSSNEFQPF